MLEAIIIFTTVILSIGLIWWTFHTSGFKNRDWETKIQEMVKVYDSALNHIEIVTDLAREFFADKRVLESLKKAAERGVQIRIVYDPAGYNLEELEDLQKLAEAGLVEVRKANQAFTKETARHVMEIDGRWARLETYHPAKQMIEAGVGARIYQSPAIAFFAGGEFDRVWKSSVDGHGDGARS